LIVPHGELLGQTRWLRGNTHVHTVNSDGSASPNRVVQWYKEHGYQFVILTDHDLRTPVEGLNAVHGVAGRFLVMAGVEVSDRIAERPVHVNGLGVRETILPQGGVSVPAAIDNNSSAIRGAGGLPVLAHPNGLLSAALTTAEITAAGITHFEVCCADYLGGSGHPSTDEIWDGVLSAGRILYGLAADDAHRFDPASRDPGSSWVMVRATELTTEAVLSALRAGEFYATTGVILAELEANERELCFTMAGVEQFGFRTVFIGPYGAQLAHDETDSPCYKFRADDTYVRARVQRSDGAIAWIQPVFRP
jgi:hypothetical protein